MRITLVDALSLAAIAVVISLVVIPRREVAAMMEREDAVVAELGEFARRLEEKRKSGTPDADGDGRAEYAPLESVLGDRRAAATPLGAGVWELDGYRFAVLVPGGLRRPVPAGSRQAVTDYAEISWMIVAWPAQPGVTGMRAYATTTYGVLLHQIDGYPYGDEPPFPDGPMVVLNNDRMERVDSYSGTDWRAPLRSIDRPEGRPPRRSPKGAEGE